jgi:hypothetical protein
MTFRLLMYVVIFALAPLAVVRSVMADSYKSNETPKYSVERTDGPIEVRLYAPRIVAEVSVSGSQSQAVSAGFRVLAGYIFGGNDGNDKVAMTTPVTQVPGQSIAMTTPVTQMARDGNWLVQFTMPSSYTLETLPEPRDASIRFVTIPSQRQIVLRFSGLARAGIMATKEGALRSWARGQAITVTAGPFYYFYDAPWTLPWNRRNEVAFVVP